MNKEILDITKKFHDTYEKLASEYTYETREDTKVFDINSNNGKLMYATVNEIVSPILKENEKLKDNWNKLKEWIKEYIETNEKWYSSELSNHDKEYYKKDYIDSKFWLMKFQNQMQEIEGGINE